MPEHHIMSGLGKAFNHIDPEHVTNGQLYSLLYAMYAQQLDSSREITELKEQLKAHKDSMKDMSEVWKTSTNMVRFIKLLAVVGIPIAGVFALAKAGILRMFSGV